MIFRQFKLISILLNKKIISNGWYNHSVYLIYFWPFPLHLHLTSLWSVWNSKSSLVIRHPSIYDTISVRFLPDAAPLFFLLFKKVWCANLWVKQVLVISIFCLLTDSEDIQKYLLTEFLLKLSFRCCYPHPILELKSQVIWKCVEFSFKQQIVFLSYSWNLCLFGVSLKNLQ